MPDDNAPSRDVLWKMYQEHCTQGRHHETQRSTVVSALLAISAAIIALITFDRNIIYPADLPLSLMLVLIGVFGAGFSMKHYERFSLHMERARRHRDALDALLPGEPLKRLKREADSEHNGKFPNIHTWRLNYWWLALNLVVALLGLVLCVIAICFPVIATS